MDLGDEARNAVGAFVWFAALLVMVGMVASLLLG
jgi:hypothetical protein